MRGAQLFTYCLIATVFFGCGKDSGVSTTPPPSPAVEPAPPPPDASRFNRPLPRPVITPRWPAFHELGMKETTIDALARIGRPAVPALVRVLHDPDPALREQSAVALARIGPDAVGAVQDLIGALDDPSESVRKNAIRALGQIGPAAAEAVPTLVDILKRVQLQAPKVP